MIRAYAQRRIIMSTENEKLIQVKKSCKGVKTVSLILMIITIVGTVLAIGFGIYLLAAGPKIDPILKQAEAEGKLHQEVAPGVSVVNIDVPNTENWNSSVPAIQARFDEGSLSFVFSIYCFIIAGSLLCMDVILWLFYNVFSIIVKEESPFSDRVIKRLLFSLILVTVFVGFTVGWGFALLSGIATWAIITIMNYGKQLQLQSDETL